MRFDELDLSDEVLDALDSMNFSQCTPIQELAIPKILDGYDLMAVAQTGTGKTAAYLLPIIDCLAGGGYPEHAINCVVMVPTHELAQQIDRQLQGFSYFLPVSGVAIYGGTDGKEFARQQHGLKTGADIVIATPGRLLAHMSMGYVDLSNTSFFVLDEADRMLDMGFYDDIMQIQRQLPQQCQTMMFSATMPPKIQQLANTILYQPEEIKISVSKPADKIDQSAFVCYEGQKDRLLLHLLNTTYSSRVIVFAASKLKVKDLTRELRRRHIKAGEMHSDLDQPARESVIEGFRNGKIDVLVATDIVARGIDIDDITMVVNYDVPHEAEDYVHRVGRTARANNDGKAVTFISEREQQKFGSIERFLEYEVRKEQMPAELGDGPQYNPTRHSSGRNNGRRNSSGRNGGGNRNGGGRSKNRSANNQSGNQAKPNVQAKQGNAQSNNQSNPNNSQAKQANGQAKSGNKRRNFRRKRPSNPQE